MVYTARYMIEGKIRGTADSISGCWVLWVQCAPLREDACAAVYVCAYVRGKITKKRLKETTAEAKEKTSGLLAGTPKHTSVSAAQHRLQALG